MMKFLRALRRALWPLPEDHPAAPLYEEEKWDLPQPGPPPEPPPPPGVRWEPGMSRVEWKRKQQASPEMSQWLRPWNGNGLTVGPSAITPREARRLYDHPRSRALKEPDRCAECGYPSFGWGSFDHWPTCSKYNDDWKRSGA